jgi:hypothetical protein
MSEQYRSAPDVRYLPVGMGHHIAFLCPRCNTKRSALGRKRLMYRGIKDLICAACLQPKDTSK